MKIFGINTIIVEEVLGIHETLVRDFYQSKDPIEPPGLRSLALLESAVGRQCTSLGNELKYKSAISNAATLCYGICCNHPFLNGNKRTALVAMLCHLDKNGLTLTEDVAQNELYSFMLKVASHRFAPRLRKYDPSDLEVEQMSRWLENRTRSVKKYERIITYRELRNVLKSYGFEMENPKGNRIDIVKYEWRRKWPIIGSKELIRKRYDHIPYPGEKKTVGKSVIKNLRKHCGLTEDEGIDSDMFYSGDTNVDHFITKYQKTLKRLAKV